jgi:hypothetical protein
MFTWTPIYKELAKALLPFKNRQPDLVRILDEIKQTGVPIIRLVDAPDPATTPPLTRIDPFTFFAAFNRGLTNQNRMAILTTLKEKFHLNSAVPADFSGVPVVDNKLSWFFPWTAKRKPDDIESLWNLAASAIQNKPEQLDPKLFNRCLEIYTVGPAKLTMGLFWINPENYLALDDKNRAHFAKAGITTEVTDHASYLILLRQAREKLGQDYTEISRHAWEAATAAPIHYWAGGSTWGKESKAEEFTNGNFWEIGWEKDDEESAAKRTWKTFQDVKVGDEFAIKGLGGRYDLKVYYVGKVIHKSDDGILKLQKLDRPLYRGKGPKGPAWFETLLPITNQSAIDAIFHSQGQTSEGGGQDSEETPPAPTLPLALNTILYGPPGTGKTYRLRNHHMKMFTDSAVAPTDEERASALVRDLSWWEVIALALLSEPDNEATVPEILQHPFVQARLNLSANKHPSQVMWGALQSHTKQDCPNVKYTARTDPLIFSKDAASVWSIDHQLADTEAPELRKILNAFRNPPPEPPVVCRYKFTTFHQSFSYEDFVEGIKPQTEDAQGRDDGHLSYEVRLGVFREICREAESNPSRNYALFIDEINRGNVASIFGELITLIEEDKRLGADNELKTKLPYSRDDFGVPKNLYIIGTMNTADRSVEALDTALRRRFTFEEMRPEPGKIEQPDNLQVDLRKLFEVINARIEQLLDHDHCIGHYYFMGIKDLPGLQSVFANKLIPLLREYFYGNPAKIGMVLGEPFVSPKTAKALFAPGSWGTDDLDEKEVFTFADATALAEKDFQAIYAETHPGV